MRAQFVCTASNPYTGSVLDPARVAVLKEEGVEPTSQHYEDRTWFESEFVADTRSDENKAFFGVTRSGQETVRFASERQYEVGKTYSFDIE